MSANYWIAFVSCVLGCLLVRSGLAEEATMTEKEENNFKFVAESVVKDGYLSNGYLYADEWVLQSFGAVTYYGFCLSAWNSIGLEDSHCAGSYASETDYELDYNFTVRNFDFMLGVASFTYPDTDKTFDDWALKAIVGYGGWWLRPAVMSRLGVGGNAEGDYTQFSLTKVTSLADDLTLKLYGSIAYATKSYRGCHGCDASGLLDAEFGARLDFSLSASASVCIGCHYNTLIDGGVRDAVKNGTAYMADGKSDHFSYYAGFDLSF